MCQIQLLASHASSSHPHQERIAQVKLAHALSHSATSLPYAGIAAAEGTGSQSRLSCRFVASAAPRARHNAGPLRDPLRTLSVVQWIERLPPKRQIQVRFLSEGPPPRCHTGAWTPPVVQDDADDVHRGSQFLLQCQRRPGRKVTARSRQVLTSSKATLPSPGSTACMPA